jgi:virginiamycin B lyase
MNASTRTSDARAPRRDLAAAAVVLTAAMLALCAAVPTLAAALPPENTVLPVISPHEPVEKVDVETTKGSWTNSPTKFKYQWLRCNAVGGACETIKNGLEAQKHVFVSADLNRALRVEVTAENSSGAATVSSELTTEVQPAGVVTGYGKPEHTPNSLAAGPDGNIWFTSGDGNIGKISPSGLVTNVASLGAGSNPGAIVAGLSGEQALWFTMVVGGKRVLKKITTSGSVSEVAIGGEPAKIAAQGTTNMWATEPDSEEVAQISSSGTVTQRHLASGVRPNEIAYSQAENAIWVNTFSNTLARLTAVGAIVEFPQDGTGEPRQLTSAREGNVWYVTGNGEPLITTTNKAGESKYFKEPIGSSQMVGGADRRLWFNDAGANYFGSMTLTGTFTVYWAEMGNPILLASSSDGHVWFVSSEGKIGKFTV